MALNIFKGMDHFSRYNDPQKNDGSDISLKLRLTNRCNYKCHYCSYRNNTEPFLDWNHLRKMLDFVEMLDRDYFYIYLHGGEPTLHPHFINFVYILNNILARKNKDYFIYFDTNFTMSQVMIRDLFDNVDDSKFKINCTYHIDQCKNLDEFIEKYKVLDRYSLQKQLNIMFQYDLFDDQKLIFEELISRGITGVVPKPIIYEGEENKYSIDQKQFFYINDPRLFYYTDNKNNNHIFSLNQIELERLNNFILLNCEYGEKNIVIDVTGDLYCCVSHQLNRSLPSMKNSSPPIINIFKEKLEQYYKRPKPKICLYTKCSACDLRILKRKL